ncbi:zinc ribbon domain-containing protein [Candidatus Woesearchaeota archaeon]|nr:zinc ribbon domain-containing protein [Candidatus Woesearchaeota archaeon]
MVKIHWSFYLMLGAGVLFASYRIDPRKFTMFIWVGYLFLIIGTAKIVYWFIGREKETKSEKKTIRRQIHPKEPPRIPAAYCQKCGNRLYGNENFCPRCGQRMRNLSYSH